MKALERLPELDIVFEIRSLHRPGNLGKIFTVIGEEGALIGDITTKFIGKTHSIREVTVSVFDEKHLETLKQAIVRRTKTEILSTKDLVFERHRGGKIHSSRRMDVRTVTDLRYIYTPGVARICSLIHRKPEKARDYTNIANSVGIFTNGTRVLGLGDLGPVPSMPVMEGKAVLYDQFVGISATPVLVDTRDPEEFVRTVECIAPTFGGIHLEDIRVPDCFIIEDELIRRLKKPVMHDDQHGTATVVLAAIMNAIRLRGSGSRRKLVVAQLGLGAAGFGIAKLLLDYGEEVVGVDPDVRARRHFEQHGGRVAGLKEAMARANIVVATTGIVGLITASMIRKGQIVLALSNPVPEISPEEALHAGAAVASDGKSINNALAYPGLFRAALETHAHRISPRMKIAAARAIARLADNDELVPSPFHPDVHANVVHAVKAAV